MNSSQKVNSLPAAEQVVEIPLTQLHPFEGHPFKVLDDDAMLEMAESIRQYGVLVPGIVRPDPDGGYEMIAQQVGSSRNQIQRYIRLTDLIPQLLDMVDEKKIALNPAYELSFLKKSEQEMLLTTMDYEQATKLIPQNIFDAVLLDNTHCPKLI